MGLSIQKASDMNCKACGKDSTFQNYAVESPWVASLIGAKPRLVKFFRCNFCFSGSTNLEFSPIQLRLLYSNYRGDHYFTTRSAWEPNYTKSLNNSLSDSKEWMFTRKKFIEETILQTVGESECSQIKTIVDVGGGHGHLFPDFKNVDKRYIVDLDENPPSSGSVLKLPGVSFIKKTDVDLVMACGLLEHLVEPQDYMKDLVSNLPNECVVFIEVPSGVPRQRHFWKRDASSKFLLEFSKHQSIFRFILRLEKYLHKISRLGAMFPMRISEHLQFFTGSGLIALCANSGITVLDCGEWNINATLPGSNSMGFQSGLWLIGRVHLE